MFSNVGWGEILILLIVGLLFIGPERLPGLIKEARAVLLAIRNAVGEARQQLDGELGEDFKKIAKPLQDLNSVRQMGAKGLITKTLLDGDDSFLKPFEDTKQDLRDTVDSVRRTPQRSSAQSPEATPSAAAAHQAGASTSAPQAVAQQADLGESRAEDITPIEQAAADLTSPTTPSAPQADSSPSGRRQDSPRAGNASTWEDVT